jgi:hypothetical protein
MNSENLAGKFCSPHDPKLQHIGSVVSSIQQSAEQERETLVKTLLDRAAIAGAQLAVIPVPGYTELEPFYKARLRPSRRIQHAYLTVWKGKPFTDPLPSMYPDVF